VQAYQAAAAQADDELSNAQKALAGVVIALRQAHEDSPDYVAANVALAGAQNAYQAELSGVLADLARRSDYQAVIKSKQAAEDAVQRARDSGATDDPGMLAALAAPMLIQASAQRKLEAEAFDASPSLQAAKNRLASARQAMDSLKQGLEDAIRADPKYADAKLAVDSARSKAGAADNAVAMAR
jgi:chromosome segregation ATPase